MLESALMFKKTISLLALTILSACSAEQGVEDPYLWLEEVEGEEALAWVEEQNAESLGYLEALPTFKPIYDRNLEIYDSEDRIVSPGLMGAYI